MPLNRVDQYNVMKASKSIDKYSVVLTKTMYYRPSRRFKNKSLIKALVLSNFSGVRGRGKGGGGLARA